MGLCAPVCARVFNLQYGMITQTLKMIFHIQSTHSHLGVDKSFSNLIYIPIAGRTPLTNHTQIIMLTNRRLQRSSKPFSLFHLHCFYLKRVAFHPIFCPLSSYNRKTQVLTYLQSRHVCMYLSKHTNIKSTLASHPCLVTLKRSGVHVVTYCMLTTKSKHSRDPSAICVYRQSSTFAYSSH